jgi:hypothetical protein
VARYLVASKDLEGVEQLGRGLGIGMLLGHEGNVLVERNMAVLCMPMSHRATHRDRRTVGIDSLENTVELDILSSIGRGHLRDVVAERE